MKYVHKKAEQQQNILEVTILVNVELVEDMIHDSDF